MKGIVKEISDDKSRFAVRTELGYTVFDCSEDDLMINDIISGNLDDHGEVALTILRTKQTFDATVEAIRADWLTAQSLIRNR